ncbi:MAG: Photosystem II manganese-stabilizing polypeptide [Chloroflexaceae bacterium]|nr:Photosystem II manganese-stabilizing polypeptide [Chloroflexaceae bacterium]
MRLRTLIVAFLALCLGLLSVSCSEDVSALSREQLTYDQIVNTGLANKCPQLGETARGSIPIETGKIYTFVDMCLEPQTYAIKVEGQSKRRDAEFVAAKVLTRDTTSLDQISGKLQAGEDGLLTLVEEDGLDFQPVTVQLPGGERVPFLFTIKQLVATTNKGFESINTSTDFQGTFSVPSYRGNVFLDPKGRGVASGYDTAVALPSRGDIDEDFTRANVKTFERTQGQLSLQITKVDGQSGEIAGIFESEQPSDTDLGAKESEEVKIRGTFYARIDSL